MIRIFISGACGFMGKAVAKLADSNSDFEVVGGIDLQNSDQNTFPIRSNITELNTTCDAIIDFSKPSSLPDLLNYTKETGVPLILCTTGYSKEEIEQIHKASQTSPIFFSANMSLGVNVLQRLVKQAAELLGNDFDIEIVEKHHNRKVDAPSGTALMLGNSVNEGLDSPYPFIYDRTSNPSVRESATIGFHSVRGGSIVGEHDVIFAGQDEVVTLRHEALSREVFASEALKAAKFMQGKLPGIYDMNNVLDENHK